MIPLFLILSDLLSDPYFFTLPNMCLTHVYLPLFILTAHAAHLPSNACRTCFYHTFSSFPTCVPHMFLTIYTVDRYLVTVVYSLFDLPHKDSWLNPETLLVGLTLEKNQVKLVLTIDNLLDYLKS